MIQQKMPFLGRQWSP